MDNTTNSHSSEPQPIVVISQKPQENREIDRTKLLSQLREISPISVYGASKKLNIPYTTLKLAIKEFENARLLKTTIMLNSPRAVRIIFFQEKEEKHGN